MLSSSSGAMNLVQVDAVVIGKGTKLIYRKAVKDFGQSELYKGMGVLPSFSCVGLGV